LVPVLPFSNCNVSGKTAPPMGAPDWPKKSSRSLVPNAASAKALAGTSKVPPAATLLFASSIPLVMGETIGLPELVGQGLGMSSVQVPL